MLKAFIFCILFFIPCSWASEASSAFLVESQSSGAYINSNIEYFVDVSEKMTLDEVRSQANFISVGGRNVLAQIRHPIWFRLKLERGHDAPLRWWLDYQIFSPRELAFYSPDQNGEYIEQISKKYEPFSAHPQSGRPFFYPIKFNDQKVMVIYWRSISHSAVIFPVRIWQQEKWIDSTLSEYLFYGLLLGIMLGLSVYNLFIYLRLRDCMFLLYFFAIVSYMFYSININGLDLNILWKSGFYRFKGLSSCITAATGIFSVLFAISLLGDSKKRKWFNYTLYGIVLVYLFVFVLVFIGKYSWAELLTQWAGGVWLPLVLGMSAYLSYLGSVWARCYLLGEGPTLIGSTLLVLLTQGVIEANRFNTTFYFVAGAWSAILFSQALAEKVNSLKKATTAALNMAVVEKNARLQEAEEYRMTLEEKVKQRTKELSLEIKMHQQTLEQLRDSQSKLEEMAYSDALTGLPNRRMFQDRLSQAFTRAQRHGGEFALALIDLDHFKRVNDSLGHAAGDQLLQIVAQHLSDTLRHCDTVARLGGDEFAMILTAPISKEDAVMICQRFLSNFDKPVLIDHKQVKTGMSIGLAWFPVDGQDIDELLGAADVALYQAKAVGRHRLNCAGYVAGPN
ncbi:MAG: diguanylate cyclase [Proteobacteria bacterium]|nr:diguanylate cyclase [Pseudomonadota bacterium]